MSILSLLLLQSAVILLIHPFTKASSNLQFGIRTSNVVYAGANAPVQLTLSWQDFSYGCSIQPYESDTLYTCLALSTSTSKSLLSTSAFSLHLAYSGDDMAIASLIVTDLDEGVSYEVTEFCLSSYLVAPQTAFVDFSMAALCSTWTNRQKFSDFLLGSTSTNLIEIVVDFRANVLNYPGQSLEGKLKPAPVTSVYFETENYGSTVATVHFALYFDTYIYYGSVQPSTYSSAHIGYTVDASTFSTSLDCNVGESVFKLYVDCASTDQVVFDDIRIFSGGYYYNIGIFYGSPNSAYLYIDTDQYGAYKYITLPSNFLLSPNGDFALTVVDGEFLQESTLTCSEEENAECGQVKQISWNELIQLGAAYENIPDLEYDLHAVQQDNEYGNILLTVNVYLSYLGYSSLDGEQYDLGTTYVVSFNAFDSITDQIDQPGNCDNRDIVDFQRTTWPHYWDYSEEWHASGALGSSDYLAYPPSEYWDLSLDYTNAYCINRVQYNAVFRLDELIECKTFGNDYVIDITTGDNWINVSGTLYVSIVSPFSMSVEAYQYYQYQLLAAPFVVTLQKSMYFVDDRDVFLFSSTIFAVYESAGNLFILLLTESAEYIELQELVLITSPNNNADIGQFEVVYDYNHTALGNECISNDNYICSQVWKLKVSNIPCPYELGGTYGFQWSADCGEPDTYSELCDSYIEQNGDIVTLTADLSFVNNICEPEIWAISFEAAVQYYTDVRYADLQDETYAYSVGIDRVFVEVTMSIPQSTYAIFSTLVQNVWLCTAADDVQLAVDADHVEGSGCFDPRVTGLSPYHIIMNINQSFSASARHESTDDPTVARFSFLVPADIDGELLYIEIQTMLYLESGANAQRRLLLSITDNAAVSSQFTHSMNDIFITDTRVDEKTPDEQLNMYVLAYSIGTTALVAVALALLCIYLIRKNRAHSAIDISPNAAPAPAAVEMDQMAMDKHLNQPAEENGGETYVE